MNALNRLALEGVLAVIESISRRCRAPSHPPPLLGTGGGGGGGTDSWRRGSVSDSDSDQESVASGRGDIRGRVGSDGSLAGAEGELVWLERARARTAEVLQERKKMKRRLGLAAQRFNTGSKGWLEYAQVCLFLFWPWKVCLIIFRRVFRRQLARGGRRAVMFGRGLSSVCVLVSAPCW